MTEEATTTLDVMLFVPQIDFLPFEKVMINNE